MRININLFDLEAFLTVADLRSFQRAADKLNVSQSAITRRIQKLENSLGVTFFERTTRSLKLTLAAKSFQQRARSILDDTDEALRVLRDETAHFEHQQNAIITIASIPTATQHIVPEAIKQFRKEGYTQRFNILDLFADEVVESVTHGDADFGISFMGMEEPGIIFEKIIDEQFVLVMQTTNPLHDKPSIPWSDIAEQPLIVPWKGTGNRLLIDNALARAKKNLHWTYQVKHSSTAIALVKAGIGVAVLPAAIAPPDANSKITTRPLIQPEVIRVLGIVRRSGHTLSSPSQRFYQLLVEAGGYLTNQASI